MPHTIWIFYVKLENVLGEEKKILVTGFCDIFHNVFKSLPQGYYYFGLYGK